MTGTRRALVGLAASTFAVGALLTPAGASAAPLAASCVLAPGQTCTYDSPGEIAPVVVPAGVTSIVAVVTGAQGGTPLDNRGRPNGGKGGGGAQVVSEFSVRTGDQLKLWVGGRDPRTGYTKGGGGGTAVAGQSGASGGGSSAVLSGDRALIVAGGGGGGGGRGNGPGAERSVGGPGGSGGLRPGGGANGEGSFSEGTRRAKLLCFPGFGGGGGRASSGTGAGGYPTVLSGAGGGGGGGYRHGGSGGSGGGGNLGCGAGGGGGAGESFVGNGARVVATSAVQDNGSGSIVLHANYTAQTFSCVRGERSWRVPSGVDQALAIVVGAEGGHPSDPSISGHPGYGANVQGAVSVTPGTDVTVAVGCNGNSGSGYGKGEGGSRGIAYSSAADNGGGGGGASTMSDSNGTELIVAGGGGGGGGGAGKYTYFNGTRNGGNGGSAGFGPGRSGAEGGQRGDADGGAGANSPSERGGNGANGSRVVVIGSGGGGGGGGGYRHGGDGGHSPGSIGGGGGGGAGESYHDSSRVSGVRYQPGAKEGDGLIAIIYRKS